VAFVLIVDANQAHASRASDALNASGHACGCVANAEQAITLLRWQLPELILLDRSIPGADGDLPRQLRRMAGVAHLPIILLTSDSAAAGRDEIDNAVLDDIRKPFDPHFLAWRVNHALEAPHVEARSKPSLRSLA
jgi:DNA-binding response OmpR family regulator